MIIAIVSRSAMRRKYKKLLFGICTVFVLLVIIYAFNKIENKLYDKDNSLMSKVVFEFDNNDDTLEVKL